MVFSDPPPVVLKKARIRSVKVPSHSGVAMIAAGEMVPCACLNEQVSEQYRHRLVWSLHKLGDHGQCIIGAIYGVTGASALGDKRAINEDLLAEAFGLGSTVDCPVLLGGDLNVELTQSEVLQRISMNSEWANVLDGRPDEDKPTFVCGSKTSTIDMVWGNRQARDILLFAGLSDEILIGAHKAIYVHLAGKAVCGSVQRPVLPPPLPDPCPLSDDEFFTWDIAAQWSCVKDVGDVDLLWLRWQHIALQWWFSAEPDMKSQQRALRDRNLLRTKADLKKPIVLQGPDSRAVCLAAKMKAKAAHLIRLLGKSEKQPYEIARIVSKLIKGTEKAIRVAGGRSGALCHQASELIEQARRVPLVPLSLPRDWHAWWQYRHEAEQRWLISARLTKRRNSLRLCWSQKKKKKVFDWVKAKPDSTLKAVLLPGGNVTFDAAEMQQAVTNAWKRVYMQEYDASRVNEFMDECHSEIATLASVAPTGAFTVAGKLYDLIAKHPKKGCAPGVDGWTWHELAKLPRPLVAMLEEMLNICQSASLWPQALRRIRLATLAKDTSLDPIRTRPIALLPVVIRAWVKCAFHEIRPWVSSWAPCELAGGMPGRTTEDVLFAVHCLMSHAKHCRRPCAALLIDKSLCFDMIPRRLIQTLWTKMGMHDELVNSYCAYMDNSERTFHVAGQWGEGITPSVGFPQGCSFAVLAMLTLGAAGIENEVTVAVEHIHLC